jgi:nucleoside-diphosphate-sugar epimerase
MKVLLTGANGFVGSHVAERFAQLGDVELRLMLRRTSKLDYIRGLEYERVEGDMRDPESLQRAVQGVDAVAHVAGATSAFGEADYQEVNAIGTAVLAEAAARAGVKRFVYVSSQAAHGPNDSPEPSIPDPPRPLTPYGRSKLAGEYPVLAQRDGMSVAVLRPPVVYGPRDRALLPFYKLAQLHFVPVYGAGDRLLTCIHVEDCADAVIAATLADSPNGAVYTLSDGSTHTWRGLVQAFARALGRRVWAIPTPPLLFTLSAYGAGALQTISRRTLPLSPDEVRHMRPRYWVCGNDAITRDLGWTPKFDIDAGFAQMLRWYRDNGWL